MLTGTENGVVQRGLSDLPTKAADSWTINQWVYMDKQPDELTILSGFGDARDNTGAERFLVKYRNSIHFWGSNVDINAGEPFDLGKWQMVTVTFDGKNVRLYKNGKELHSEPAVFTDAVPTVRFAPNSVWDDRGGKFAGKIAGFTIWREALPADYIQMLASSFKQ